MRNEDLIGPNGVIFNDSDQMERFKTIERRGMFLRHAFSWTILEDLELIEPIVESTGNLKLNELT